MSRVLFFVMILALVLAQYTVLPRYMPLGIAPDIVLVVLFYRFLRCGLQEALLWIFVIGIVLDILALDRLGAHPLSLVPLVIAAQPLRSRPWLVNPVSCVVLIGMAALFNSMFLSLMRGRIGLVDVAVQLAFQIIIAAAGYWVYRRFYKR